MSAASGGSFNSSHNDQVKLAGSESKDKMYEPKHKKKLVRVLTVCAYLLSVSLPAITFSLFYVFIYNPDRPSTTLLSYPVVQTESEDYFQNQSQPQVIEEPRALPVHLVKPNLPSHEESIHLTRNIGEYTQTRQNKATLKENSDIAVRGIGIRRKKRKTVFFGHN